MPGADWVSAAPLDGVQGRRWKTETVNSVIKRKAGDDIRSRRRSLQNRQPVVKGLGFDILVWPFRGAAYVCNRAACTCYRRRSPCFTLYQRASEGRLWVTP